jgi:hypothetical protein
VPAPFSGEFLFDTEMKERSEEDVFSAGVGSRDAHAKRSCTSQARRWGSLKNREKTAHVLNSEQ